MKQVHQSQVGHVQISKVLVKDQSKGKLQEIQKENSTEIFAYSTQMKLTSFIMCSIITRFVNAFDCLNSLFYCYHRC